MTMAQIATVGALNPLAAEGAWGVVEADAVAETDAELVLTGTEEEEIGRTVDLLTEADEAAVERAVAGTEEETAVAIEETNDWETTSPVVSVMVKPLE